ncbi:MAG: orotate phosphoribosyltransferase [Muribaculaceae bacterium]|nr:orotate phosphoribosyltransferase [Muribaculaceae bacterium]
MKKPDYLLAEKLLQISAIKLQPDNPFIWGSGWNAPIYLENPRLLSYPDIRNLIKIEMSKIVIENFPEADVIASVSTGAIPMGALVADTIGLPFLFVRSTPKDHGLENLIEGNLKPGQKVVLVDDLISTGASAVKASEELRLAGGEVIGLTSIFNFEFPMAVKRLRDANIPLISVVNYSAMLDVALDTDYICKQDLGTLQEWREDPANWVPNDKE